MPGEGRSTSVLRPSSALGTVALTLWALPTAALVVAPLVHLVMRATEQGWAAVRATLDRPRTVELVTSTVGLAATVTAASLVVGIGCAWLVARTDLPGRQVWQVLFGLPLALPSYVAAWAWIDTAPNLAGRTGAVLVLTSVSYPYVYLPVLATLRRADPALEEVARALGRGPVRTFLTVTLRQVRVAAAGGALLAGLYTLSDFGAVSIMRYETLTFSIYRAYRTLFDRTPAAVLGCVLVMIALVVVVAEGLVRRSERQDRVGRGTDRPATPIRLGWGAVPGLIGAGGLVAGTLGVPAWRMVTWVTGGTSRADLADVGRTGLTTLGLGAGAAVLTVALALPVGLLSARRPTRLSRLITAAAYGGHALPGITVALAMVFFGIRVVPSFYQRTPLLVVAYAVLFMSLAVGAIHAAVAQVPPGLDEVARSLGRSRLAAWREVTFRLASPGIGAGAALVFLTTMKELPATLLLRPTGMDTLATSLWSRTEAFSYGAAAPYAAAIVILAALPTALLTYASGRRRP